MWWIIALLVLVTIGVGVKIIFFSGSFLSKNIDEIADNIVKTLKEYEDMSPEERKKTDIEVKKFKKKFKL